ncbi:Dabb family protein [Nonomuraea fuscirosea]|jgi:hypothetical protein|uniref:Dabb family protein n=1 Tax=Nonomuraea fuscirosea TaxID=1291556 RepID=UPI002DDAF681|nr:Dabb family protein [Nonomuraea fuscirosea]WSA49087.1 Dabb family protein [Nonomuraea fuscirosea]
MIYHCIRFTAKPGVTEADRQAALESMRAAARAIPAIKSHVVGPDFGGDYEYGSISVMEDLEGYAEMMNHPAHLEVDRKGLPLVDRFASFDITDDPDPEIGVKIAAIHRRRYATVPDIAALVADLPEYTGSATPPADAD